jgi:hypothetical protein
VDEFLEQSEAAVCDLFEECYEGDFACAADQFFDPSECFYDERAADDCVAGLTELTCDTFPDVIPRVCADVWECFPCDDDPLFEEMDNVSEGLTGDRDVFCRDVDTNLSVAPTVAGNPDWGVWFGGGDHTDVSRQLNSDTKRL